MCVLSTGYAHLPDELKFVYALIALLSEGKNDVIILAPNREVEAMKLRPLRLEFPAVWPDISNALRGLTDHSLHIRDHFNVRLSVGIGTVQFQQTALVETGNRR